MSRSNDVMVHEVRRWKDRISTLENIPLNPDHKYKDENDVYERLTAYVKGWVESMFLVHTNENGELVSNFGREDSKEVEEWLEANNNNVTRLHTGWWDAALTGLKKDDEPLPQFDASDLKKKTEKEARQDVKDAVVQYFFPAYRALKESFDKRWWFEWIFNHKRYIAERDALKVMTSLVTSMTGMTNAELKEEYRRNQEIVSPAAVAKANVAKFDRQQALAAEEIEKAMNDPNYGKEEPREEPKQVEVVVHEDVENTLELFESRDNDVKGFYETICTDLIKVLEGNCILNESAMKDSVPEHIYAPLQNIARDMCTKYDQAKKDGTLDSKANELMENGAKRMFEKAFKGLAATYATGEVNTAMTGKLVFGMNSLKAHIIAAQKLTDVMLKGLTPVGFNAHKHEQFSKGYHIWEKTDEVRTFLKETLKDKYSDKQIDWELKAAKNEIGVLYHNAKREVSQVYEIGYRPEVSDLKLLESEGRKLRNLNRMITPAGKQKTRLISDPSIIAVIGENYKRWKAVDEWRNKNVKFDLKKAEAEWGKTDKQLTNIHTSYVPNDTESFVEGKLAEAKERQQLKMAVNGDQSKTVPPINPNAPQANPSIIKNK